MRVLILCLAIFSIQALGLIADAYAGDPGSAIPTADEAKRFEAEGKRLMRASNADPALTVDAAVALSKALRYYEKSNDVDRICDLEADIFWCKKRMNVDGVKRFVEAKDGRSAADIDAVAKAEEVATRKVDTSEAEGYFARAERFAREHADDPFAIAVRYFEVAQRFAGTTVGLKAQENSLAAQAQAMQVQEAAHQAQEDKRQTLFSRPAQAKSEAAAIPSAADQKTATALVRRLYKDGFARSKPAQKRKLSAQLLSEAERTNDDPNLRWGLIAESASLAIDSGDLATLMTAAKMRAEGFSGVDVKTTTREWVVKMRTPVASSANKLLDTPDDAVANGTVGRWFATDARRWEDALPLLSRGDDAAWRKASEMELAGPTGAAQQAELADVWYIIGVKNKDAVKEALWAHALEWYQSAQAGLTGGSAARVATTIAEIEAFLPPAHIDWSALTPEQWDRLKAPVKTISIMQDRTPTGVTVVPGRKLRVVPHPTDTWSVEGLGIEATVDWKGYAQAGKQGDHQIAALVVYVGTATAAPGIISGNGALMLGPYRPVYVNAKKGEIRVKIIPVDEEE